MNQQLKLAELWGSIHGWILTHPHECFAIAFQIAIIAVVGFFIFRRFNDSLAIYLLGWGSLVGTIIGLIYLLKLTIFIKIIEFVLPSCLLLTALIFTPEIRNYILNTGQKKREIPQLFKLRKSASKDEATTKSSHELTDSIVSAIKDLVRNKTGALLVFDNTWSDRSFVNSGTRMESLISTELLLNIFYPKSPLHDGAVLIRANRIHSAAVILPLTSNPKLNPWQYGTRHRAALGISEHNHNMLCIVVSEETGSISIAKGGKLSKLSKFEELFGLIHQEMLKQGE